MAKHAGTSNPAEGQSCFTWVADLPCFSRRTSLENQEIKEVRTSSVQREHGSVLWGAGPNAAEMLHVVFPELPTARDFFRRFLADNADYTILDGDSAPWNEHMVTSDGELELWTKDRTRKMRFLAYPVPPGWVPFKKYILGIEHHHTYQFVIDRKTGAEVLQLEAQIHVEQTHGSIPYADCFTTRQLWTVRSIPSPDNCNSTVCELHVTAECNFIGRPPLMAAVVRNRCHAEHRAGTQGWLNGARACLERLPDTPRLLLDIDNEDATLAVHNFKHQNSSLKFACPWAWLMATLIFMMWISLVAVEFGTQVMPSPVKVVLDPVYPSILLSLRGLLAL
jgi:hypothetical protein